MEGCEDVRERQASTKGMREWRDACRGNRAGQSRYNTATKGTYTPLYPFRDQNYSARHRFSCTSVVRFFVFCHNSCQIWSQSLALWDRERSYRVEDPWYFGR